MKIEAHLIMRQQIGIKAQLLAAFHITMLEVYEG
jgi:hypothetical protein